MKVPVGVLILVGGFVLTAGAHHSFDAEFDRTRPMELDGTVSRFEWTNPHSYLYVDVVDESGGIVTWKLEMGAPRVMSTRLGWSPDLVSAGDHVRIQGFHSRASGDNRGLAHLVTLPGGETLQASLAFGRAGPR